MSTQRYSDPRQKKWIANVPYKAGPTPYIECWPERLGDNKVQHDARHDLHRAWYLWKERPLDAQRQDNVVKHYAEVYGVSMESIYNSSVSGYNTNGYPILKDDFIASVYENIK